MPTGGELHDVTEDFRPARPSLAPSDVWTILKAGCNTAEIAAYAQVSKTVARAMCAEALKVQHSVAKPI